MRPFLAIAVVAIAALAFPARAQIKGARELLVGVPISAPAGKPGQIDYYYFTGEPGSHQGFTLTTEGEAEMVLIAPTGDVMLNTHGKGKINLEAVLSWLDVHVVAVTRASPFQPYTLSMTATEPTPTESEFAMGVGYQFVGNWQSSSRCWVVPGTKWRLRADNRGGEATLSADRSSMTVTQWQASYGTMAVETAYRIDGDAFVARMKWPSGLVEEKREPITPATFKPNRDYPAYTGYYCDLPSGAAGD